MFFIKRICRAIKRLLCNHEDFVVLSEVGPTARGKIWVSCVCLDCGRYFVYEKLSGKRYMTDGPGYGFTVV